ncbi:MAG TPA: substrate-binding domain-containing protein, partial [Roseiflexaceae bacterium]|nr:substrate-binding domain-containing protein [Roseiflexaceae bacterium]
MRRTTTTIGIVYLVIALATTIGQYLTGALGAAPLTLPLAPTPEPVVVTVWTSSSKQDWFNSAAERFATTNPRVGRRPVVVRIELVDSSEQVDQLQRQQWNGTPPTAISPTSSEWLARLDRQRAANGQAGTLLAGGESAPRSLALTPLVAVVWADRAAVLWPNGTSRFWQDIHDAVVQPSWQQVAEQHGFGPDSASYTAAQRWGAVKFVHPSPLTSSSGAHTLLMLAYAYHAKASNLTLADVADPGFQTWLGD